MDEKKDEKELYIPANCSPMDYIVEGYTAKEFWQIGIVAVVAAVIAIIIYISSQNTLPALVVLLMSIGAAIVFFGRDKHSENSIDKIKLVYMFYKAQKKYEYRYVNIYENTQEGIKYDTEREEHRE